MENKIIVASATPAGKGGVAVIRISGQGSLNCALSVFASSKTDDASKLEPNVMYFGNIVADGVRDEGYLVFFKAPKSFTGEDAAELQCHGGRGIVAAIISALCKNGAYPAERGEFTKRAFLNGRLSLSDAEGVADMINAESRAALKAAYRMMSGELSKEIHLMQSELVKIIAALEARLDYPDEVGAALDGGDGGYAAALKAVCGRMQALLAAAPGGAVIKRGVNAALVGSPNTGKSSLLNRFLKKDRAIVADLPGTTRDTLEESLEFDGTAINLTDTAGLRSDACGVEQKGIERSYIAAGGADAVVYVIDSAAFQSDAAACAEAFFEFLAAADGETPVIIALNKNDLQDGETRKKSLALARKLFGGKAEKIFSVSAHTGDGADALLGHIAAKLRDRADSDAALMTNRRHEAALRAALADASEALDGMSKGADAECVLVDLRGAWSRLGQITGQTAAEDIVDEIFSGFCLGK